MDWDSASNDCATQGATLAHIDDAAENAFIASQVSTAEWSHQLIDSTMGNHDPVVYRQFPSDTADFFWIGLNDRGTEGTFVWQGGQSDYTNWFQTATTHEPNNYYSGQVC
eukprot:SAG31_NODE_350_length_17241_cov_156.139715_8_plen_110_part_00